MSNGAKNTFEIIKERFNRADEMYSQINSKPELQKWARAMEGLRKNSMIAVTAFLALEKKQTEWSPDDPEFYEALTDALGHLNPFESMAKAVYEQELHPPENPEVRQATRLSDEILDIFHRLVGSKKIEITNPEEQQRRANLIETFQHLINDVVAAAISPEKRAQIEETRRRLSRIAGEAKRFLSKHDIKDEPTEPSSRAGRK